MMTTFPARHAVAILLLGGVLAGSPARALAQEEGRHEAEAVPASPRPAPPRPPAAGIGAGPAAGVTIPAPVPAFDRAAIEERWGIQVQGLFLTAGGYMLDFRYKVTAAGKSASLFDRRTKPLLRDEATGAVMAVPVPPKTGALRSVNDPKEGRTYFVFFANPARFVKPFSRVTVAIGEFAVSGLVVR